MGEERGRFSAFWSNPLGRFMIGFLKLAMAGVILALISNLTSLANDVTTTVGNTQITIPVKLFVTLIGAFAPIMLLISGLKDMGVDM